MRCAAAILVGSIAVCALVAPPALALEMPSRKPGLWELTMQMEGPAKMVQVMKHCIDAATDKLMNSQFGGSAQNCSKQDVVKSGATMTIDAVCTFGGATVTSHSVVTGSFDSGYTVDMTSTSTGGPPMPGAGGATHMKIAAKWLGACAAGQRPGDMILPNGMKMNVLEMPQMPGGAPRRP